MYVNEPKHSMTVMSSTVYTYVVIYDICSHLQAVNGVCKGSTHYVKNVTAIDGSCLGALLHV